jgi:hypothetical protein
MACQSEQQPINDITEPSTLLQDTLLTRELPQRRLSIKDAFLKLSKEELLLDGLKHMSTQERKALLKLGETAEYKISWVGNYLKITEKASNEDDQLETLEQIRLAIFNSLKQENILFISQESIDESRQKVNVLHQNFYQYQHRTWVNINQLLPLITTQTFLEKNSNFISHEDFFYLDPNPLDINYLQAVLIHENYPDKNEIVNKEAYKVALVWNGNEFILNRQAMVQYNISEHHSH